MTNTRVTLPILMEELGLSTLLDEKPGCKEWFRTLPRGQKKTTFKLIRTAAETGTTSSVSRILTAVEYVAVKGVAEGGYPNTIVVQVDAETSYTVYHRRSYAPTVPSVTNCNCPDFRADGTALCSHLYAIMIMRPQIKMALPEQVSKSA